MNEKFAARERKIADLLLQGYENAEISRELNISSRVIKEHCHELFVRFGITSGIKRVKLAVLLYRRQKCQISEKAENSL